MRVIERYASAVHATSLKSDPATYLSNTDVLGAMSIASRYEPLGVALARLMFAGGTYRSIATMTQMVVNRGYKIKNRVTKLQARELSIAVLAWYRFGACQPCGGTGFKRIAGTPVNGDECNHCGGTGKLPFERQFAADVLPLAQWLSSEIDRNQAAAGYAAMVALAPKLDL